MKLEGLIVDCHHFGNEIEACCGCEQWKGFDLLATDDVFEQIKVERLRQLFSSAKIEQVVNKLASADDVNV